MLKRVLPLSILFLVACGKEPPLPLPATQSPAPPAAAPAAAAGGGTAKTDLAQGESIYNRSCVACHLAGVAGAPKLGDKANWAPRIAQGMDTLYMHSIKGFQGKFGMMPPKGGNLALSDAEVKAAVDYMVSKSK